MRRFAFRRRGEDWSWKELHEPVPLAGVSALVFEVMVLSYTPREPKPSHTT